SRALSALRTTQTGFCPSARSSFTTARPELPVAPITAIVHRRILPTVGSRALPIGFLRPKRALWQFVPSVVSVGKHRKLCVTHRSNFEFPTAEMGHVRAWRRLVRRVCHTPGYRTKFSAAEVFRLAPKDNINPCGNAAEQTARMYSVKSLS